MAAALWYPYRALPQDRVTAWSRDVVRRASAALAGRRRDRRADAARHRGAARAAGRPVVGGRGAGAGRGTRADGYADGWTFTAPVVEMPVYLRWLAARVDELGGTVTRMNLRRLPGPTADAGRGGQLRGLGVAAARRRTSP